MLVRESSLVERVRTAGVTSASPVDLLALGFSRRPADAEMGEKIARKMFPKFGKIMSVNDLDYDQIKAETGLEDYEVLRTLALIELGRRAGLAAKGKPKEVEVPDDLYNEVERLRYKKQEHFVAILLDAKNRVMRTVEIHVGTLTASLVGPREVFRQAIREGASSLIVAHNHPSGDPTPSPEDIEVTRRLVDVGKILDIPVLDHLIVGDPATISLRRRGLL